MPGSCPGTALMASFDPMASAKMAVAGLFLTLSGLVENGSGLIPTFSQEPLRVLSESRALTLSSDLKLLAHGGIK